MQSKKYRRIRNLMWLLASPLLLAGGFVLCCNLWITLSTQSRIFSANDEVPSNGLGVVLGTSKKLGPNRPNLHFKMRMEAAAELYNSGKVRHLLVSGSQDPPYYSEPVDMTEALTKLGVPESAITQDASGFRTLDSVVRTSQVFGQNHYTIISDDFHVSRAVFLARRYDQDVIGYAAEGVNLRLSATSRIREVFARVKAILDVYILGTQPRELGQPAPIQIVQGS